jgi:hypothetical protein
VRPEVRSIESGFSELLTLHGSPHAHRCIDERKGIAGPLPFTLSSMKTLTPFVSVPSVALEDIPDFWCRQWYLG